MRWASLGVERLIRLTFAVSELAFRPGSHDHQQLVLGQLNNKTIQKITNWQQQNMLGLKFSP